jgi:hypothetical protein
MNAMLELVKKMHNKFSINAEKVTFTSVEKEFRLKCLQEEIDEYKDATSAHEQLDALVDLVVFAFGTAERQGWLDVFEEAFNRVMDANLTKEVGPNLKRDSFALDLVKPKGWVAADLTDLVKESGQNTFDLVGNNHD